MFCSDPSASSLSPISARCYSHPLAPSSGLREKLNFQTTKASRSVSKTRFKACHHGVFPGAPRSLTPPTDPSDSERSPAAVSADGRRYIRRRHGAARRSQGQLRSPAHPSLRTDLTASSRSGGLFRPVPPEELRRAEQRSTARRHRRSLRQLPQPRPSSRPRPRSPRQPNGHSGGGQSAARILPAVTLAPPIASPRPRLLLVNGWNSASHIGSSERQESREARPLVYHSCWARRGGGVRLSQRASCWPCVGCEWREALRYLRLGEHVWGSGRDA